MQALAFFNRATKPFRAFLLLPVLNVMGRALAISGVPYLVKKIVDSAAGPDESALIFFSSCILAAEVLNELLSRGAEWAQMHYEPAMRNHITALTLTKLMEQPYSFLQNHRAGSLIAHAADLVMLPKLISLVLVDILQPLLGSSIALLVAYRIQPFLAVFLACWTFFFCAIAWRGVRSIRPLAARSAVAKARVTGRIVDVLTHLREVRLGGGGESEMRGIAAAQQKFITANRQRGWMGLWINAAQGLSYFIYQCVSVSLLLVWYERGGISAGGFAFSLATNSALIFSLWSLGEAASKATDMAAGIERALAVFGTPYTLHDAAQAVPLHVSHGAITFQSVTFGYGGGRPLFKDFSLVIPGGQKVGLVGYSGSGKTTLVQLLLRLHEVQDGRILIDGQDCRQVTQRSLREAVSLVPQEPALFHRTVRENIAYASPTSSLDDIIAVARQAAIHDTIMQLPEGYDTVVGERGAKLSGGQRQRIALARALLKRAPILILDEATSALDTLTERAVQLSLEEWLLSRGVAGGQTTLVIAHRLSTLQAMDRILVFENGAVVQDGTHAGLSAVSGLYRELWRARCREGHP